VWRVPKLSCAPCLVAHGCLDLLRFPSPRTQTVSSLPAQEAELAELWLAAVQLAQITLNRSVARGARHHDARAQLQ